MTVTDQYHHTAAIVTGASSGIGRAIAVALAAEGCHVYLVGRQMDSLEVAAAGLSGSSSIVVADISNDLGIAAVARCCPPTVDFLVHSAGIFHRGAVADTPSGTFDEIQAVNYRAPLLLTAACLPALRSARGQIVFINSTAALSLGNSTGAYAASKCALKSAVDAMRREMKGSGIRMLSIYPGRTDTPMQQRVLSAEGRSDEDVPLLQPADVAAVTLTSLRTPRRIEVTDIVIRPCNQ
jgi:short-subunit dehydrogenase